MRALALFLLLWCSAAFAAPPNSPPVASPITSFANLVQGATNQTGRPGAAFIPQLTLTTLTSVVTTVPPAGLISSLCDPRVAGISVSGSWAAFEPTQGNYQFNQTSGLFAQIASMLDYTGNGNPNCPAGSGHNGHPQLIAFGIYAGAGTPSWICAAPNGLSGNGVPTLGCGANAANQITVKITQNDGTVICGSPIVSPNMAADVSDIPNPASPSSYNYQNASTYNPSPNPHAAHNLYLNIVHQAILALQGTNFAGSTTPMWNNVITIKDCMLVTRYSCETSLASVTCSNTGGVVSTSTYIAAQYWQSIGYSRAATIMAYDYVTAVIDSWLGPNRYDFAVVLGSECSNWPNNDPVTGVALSQCQVGADMIEALNYHLCSWLGPKRIVSFTSATLSYPPDNNYPTYSGQIKAAAALGCSFANQMNFRASIPVASTSAYGGANYPNTATQAQFAAITVYGALLFKQTPIWSENQYQNYTSNFSSYGIPGPIWPTNYQPAFLNR